MPRERVQHGKSYPIHELSGGGGEAAGAYSDVTPSLDIEWARDPQGRVQIAIEFSRERWMAIAKDLQDNSVVEARAIYTESLDRRELNHMIRTLRRARDAAYGADE
ncbi:hypothetical protein [Microbacterium sp. BH-3-3-3]|uniref:hypothetical protein n=1 Tax=Microbacterium sp. BH-3-3-3 TaxID=1906742 RepID=UPI0011A72297|nr:hypothetical protein [Microbacterium sp. BH-3-3-3]